MGLCSSKNDDKKKKEGELEEVEIEEVKISSFDNAFQKTKNPANNLVTMNNSLLASCERFAEVLGLVPPPPFAVAIKEFFVNLKKECGEAMKSFKLDVDTSGIADGKINLNPTFDFDPVKTLPEKLQKGWEAIFGEEGLINQIKKFVSNLTTINPELAEAKTAVEALPTSPDEIKSAAEGAGIGGMDLLKVPGKIAGNVKQSGRVPEIIKTFINTIKSTIEFVQNAVKELTGGAPSEGKSTEKKEEEPKKEEAASTAAAAAE
jgi:hypothetical protein